MTAADTMTTAARPDDESRVRDLCATLLAEAPPAATGAPSSSAASSTSGWPGSTSPRGSAGWACRPKLQKVINETLGAAGAPRAGVRNPIGHGMGAPTVVTHGSDAQKRRYLRPLFTGEEIWCQLFSEPGAGSDVAGLSSRAVRDGDEWVVNGQKVWTTLAHLARWGMLVARTDPDAPKHKGLTYFVVDMHAPGVEVRPLYQITGEAEFNEVYFTDVRIPDAERLGDVGEGWRVSLTTLMNERVSIGGQIPPRGSGFDRRAGQDLPRHRAPTTPPPATGWCGCGSGPRCCGSPTSGPATTAPRAPPAPRARSASWRWPRSTRTSASSRSTCSAPAGMLFPAGYPMARPETTALWTNPQQAFLRARANSIEGGTTEIMKNILASGCSACPATSGSTRIVRGSRCPGPDRGVARGGDGMGVTRAWSRAALAALLAAGVACSGGEAAAAASDGGAAPGTGDERGGLSGRGRLVPSRVRDRGRRLVAISLPDGVEPSRRHRSRRQSVDVTDAFALDPDDDRRLVGLVRGPARGRSRHRGRRGRRVGRR